MKKIGKFFLTLVLIAAMLLATIATASAVTAPSVGGDDDEPVGHVHTYEFKGFEWTINKDKRIYKAFALYECTGCGYKRNVQATVTVTSTEYIATITAAKSLDGKAHSEHLHIHEWKFKGFEWNTDNGYIAFARYQCKTCGESCCISANVTRTARGYRASVTATQALDGVARYETINVGIGPVVGPVTPRTEIIKGDIGELKPVCP